MPLRYVISQVGISQHIYPNTIYPNTIYPKPFDSSRVVSFAPLIPHLTKRQTRLVARLLSKSNPFTSPRDAPSHKLFCYSTPINVKPILQTKRRAFSSRQTWRLPFSPLVAPLPLRRMIIMNTKWQWMKYCHWLAASTTAENFSSHSRLPSSSSVL